MCSPLTLCPFHFWIQTHFVLFHFIFDSVPLFLFVQTCSFIHMCESYIILSYKLRYNSEACLKAYSLVSQVHAQARQQNYFLLALD
ncbi:hypothetical protein M6B38_178600 [Iris pallida]|uniref:Uncharacterized protein n=1 Tax=Iris pallida TaxID=29817 RepID=A0AAX6EPI8_IRIPA|nr:hypothetical protein M6B38_178600 [Iris pallida]